MSKKVQYEWIEYKVAYVPDDGRLKWHILQANYGVWRDGEWFHNEEYWDVYAKFYWYRDACDLAVKKNMELLEEYSKLLGTDGEGPTWAGIARQYTSND